MIWASKAIGNECRTDNFLMFFGNRTGTTELIQKEYPELELRFLKQIHGKLCVESTNSEVEADAHWTSEKNVALCIKTADCTPILLATDKVVCAIHAGWRGVLNEILVQSLKNIASDYSVAMGPHIQKDSFQVDSSLGHEFSDKFGQDFVFQKPEHADKSYVDLKEILRQQLNSSPQKISEYWCSKADTLTDAEYFSHRAEPANMGRNISFVTRL